MSPRDAARMTTRSVKVRDRSGLVCGRSERDTRLLGCRIRVECSAISESRRPRRFHSAASRDARRWGPCCSRPPRAKRSVSSITKRPAQATTSRGIPPRGSPPARSSPSSRCVSQPDEMKPTRLPHMHVPPTDRPFPSTVFTDAVHIRDRRGAVRGYRRARDVRDVHEAVVGESLRARRRAQVSAGGGHASCRGGAGGYPDEGERGGATGPMRGDGVERHRVRRHERVRDLARGVPGPVQHVGHRGRVRRLGKVPMGRYVSYL